MTPKTAVISSFAFAAALSASLFGATATVAPSGDIQGAINSVAAAGGGTVSVTSGSANRSGSIRMKSKVTLNGAGNPTTTFNGIGTLGNDIGYFMEQSGGNLNTVTMSNFKVYGPGKTVQSDAVRIGGTGNSNIKFQNLQTLNCGGMGSLMGSVSTGTISSCNFHDSGLDLFHHCCYVRNGGSVNISGSNLTNSPFGAGLHIAGTTSGGSVKTTTLNTNGEDGINIQDSPSNYTVDSCTANNNRNATAGRSDGIGINAQSGTGTISNNHASGNRVNYQISSSYNHFNNL